MNDRYTDDRTLQNDYTHVDAPIQRTNGTGTVTWVDFINFRKVENFGYESKKLTIGSDWLTVLAMFESLFKDLDSRIKALDNKINLYHAGANSSISGNTDFGDDTVISLQTQLNCNWNIISGGSYFSINPTTGTNVTITYIGGITTFEKGTIRCENDNSTINITSTGSPISFSYMADSTTRECKGIIQATNVSDPTDFSTIEISKPSPYQNAGQWNFEYDTNKFISTGSYSNGTITLRPINTSESTTDTLVCKNSNASNIVTKTITYTAAVQTYTVSLSVTNGTKSPNSVQTVNRGDSVSWTIMPNTGYQMPTSVSGGTISGNTVTFNNITADRSFTVACVQQTFEVTLSVTNGTKSPNSSQSVVYDGSVSWTITPNSGYQMPTSVTGGTISGNTVTFNNITTNKQFSLTCSQIQIQYSYYFGVATEDQVQNQSYINGLGYNIAGEKPATINFKEGFNVLVVPESWGTPIVKDPNGFTYSAFGLDELGITNPAGKIVLVYSSGPTAVTLEWN